jgi:hypothetical protein
MSSNPGSGSKIRNPDLQLEKNSKNAGSGYVSGSALNQCGFETLLGTAEVWYTDLTVSANKI